MTEPISPVHEIQSATRFTVRGQSFQLDLLETIYTFRKIHDETPVGDDSYHLYLTNIIEHIHRETGVMLTLGEADWLNDEVPALHAETKKKRRERFASTQTSPSSTASTPAD